MNEEDIKILENLKENVALFSGGWQPILKQEEKQAIENLINRNKELEEKNRVYHIKISNNLERIKQLEDTNKKLYEIGKEIGKQHKYTSENYIPKSKVEETIEELNRKIKYEDNEKVIIWLHKQKKILQELLEK